MVGLLIDLSINEYCSAFNLPLAADILSLYLRRKKNNVLVRYYATDNHLCKVFSAPIDKITRAYRSVCDFVSVNVDFLEI